MKRLLLFLPGLMALAANNASAVDAPRGSVLELHSCELFAGGCVVSSEAPQGGRYMLRAWKFSGGSFHGVELDGLQVAALQVSPDNLAAPGAKSGEAVIYLPESASATQREALASWLKSTQPDFQPSRTDTKVVSLRFERTDEGYVVSAGESISVRTAPFQRCDAFACGESLWYEPRSQTSLFTVALDHSEKISEPLLQLKWSDGGKRNVFLGRFGSPESTKNLYVGIDELCGPTKTLF